MTGITSCPSCGARNRVPTAANGRIRCAECHTDLPWLVEVGDADFSAAVEASPLPVLVDIWAPWCGPCRAIAPVIEQLSKELAGRLKVAKVNADTSPTTSARHAVSSIPTLIIYDDGHEIARTVGAVPADRLRTWINESLSKASV